jgi:hypothetical protein
MGRTKKPLCHLMRTSFLEEKPMYSVLVELVYNLPNANHFYSND